MVKSYHNSHHSLVHVNPFTHSKVWTPLMLFPPKTKTTIKSGQPQSPALLAHTSQLTPGDADVPAWPNQRPMEKEKAKHRRKSKDLILLHHTTRTALQQKPRQAPLIGFPINTNIMREFLMRAAHSPGSQPDLSTTVWLSPFQVWAGAMQWLASANPWLDTTCCS